MIQRKGDATLDDVIRSLADVQSDIDTLEKRIKNTSYRAVAHIDGAPFSKREAWEGMRTELINRKNDLLFQIKDLLREDDQ